MRPKYYPAARDGEWIQPRMSGYRMACCDCGLVHNLRFRIVTHGGQRAKVIFTASRNNRATAALRRYRKYPATLVHRAQ